MALLDEARAASSPSTVSFKWSTSVRSSSSFCFKSAASSEVALSTEASWLRSSPIRVFFSMASAAYEAFSESKVFSVDSIASI